MVPSSENKKSYETPTLKEFGSLTSVTKGKSGPGTDNSSQRQTQAP